MSQLIKCLYCPQSTTFYRFAKQLEAHIAAEHLNLFQYKCQLCKFMWLPTEYALAKHYSDVHEIVSGIPFDACEENNCKTEKLNELEDKLKKCIEATQALDNRNKSQLELTPCDHVKCQDCSLQFNNEEWLEAHIASVHLHSMPYRCKLCENACFPTEYTLKRHYSHDHGTSNFRNTFNFSSEVVKEREELAKKVELCISKRKIGKGMEVDRDLEANRTNLPVTTAVNVSGPQPEDVTVKTEPSGSPDSSNACEGQTKSPGSPQYPEPTTRPVSQDGSMQHQQNGHRNVTTGATVSRSQQENVVVKMEPLDALKVPPGFTDRCLLPGASNEGQTISSGIPVHQAPMPWGSHNSGPTSTAVYQDGSMQYQQYVHPNVTYQTENPYQYNPPGSSNVPGSQNESSGIPAQHASLPTRPHYVGPMNTRVYQDVPMQYQQYVHPIVPGYPAENPMMPMELPLPQYEERDFLPGVYSVVGPLCPPGFQDQLNLSEFQSTLTLVNRSKQPALCMYIYNPQSNSLHYGGYY